MIQREAGGENGPRTQEENMSIIELIALAIGIWF